MIRRIHPPAGEDDCPSSEVHRAHAVLGEGFQPVGRVPQRDDADGRPRHHVGRKRPAHRLVVRFGQPTQCDREPVEQSVAQFVEEHALIRLGGEQGQRGGIAADDLGLDGGDER